MATTSKTLFRGAASGVSTTLYTTPASTVTVVTSIIVTNTTASQQTFTLSLGGTVLAQDVIIASYDSLVIDIKQVLTATQVIAGLASSTSVNFHIAGVEIV
ncbi:MAG: hypothetical protein ACO3E4_06905 [Candidatus Nanopelagicaceae bacterium]|jgi:hypothetical protein